jgi:hypothetical protein
MPQQTAHVCVAAFALNARRPRAYLLSVGDAAQRGGAIAKKESLIVNRMTRYALALALGLSAISTAAFAANPSQTQSANAAYVSPDMQGAQSTSGPYDAPYQYLGGV